MSDTGGDYLPVEVKPDRADGGGRGPSESERLTHDSDPRRLTGKDAK